MRRKRRRRRDPLRPKQDRGEIVDMEIEDCDSFNGNFEVKDLQKHLQLCILEVGHVSMDEYIQVFKQLYKFFCMLGTVFGFVGSDVKAKVQILEEYRKGSNKDEYVTVEKMLEYEISKGLLQSNKETNGSRTFLRLHRSLLFVAQFLDKSLQIADHDGTGHISKVAYDNTLAKYHPWLIRKGAHLAMYALPTRINLFKQVCGDHVQTSEIDNLVREVIDLIQNIYDKCDEFCETLYADKKLLSLP